MHVFGSTFGFGIYVKELIDFQAFYIFGWVSVWFPCIIEMAFRLKIIDILIRQHGDLKQTFAHIM